MAMTIGDADDVQTLVRWATGTPRPGGDAVSSDDARDAAVRLAARSARILMAGLSGEDVAEHWPAPSEAGTDPLAHVRTGDSPDPNHDNGIDPCCLARHPVTGLLCTREPEHPGQHIAGAGDYVAGTWPADVKAAARPAGGR